MLRGGDQRAIVRQEVDRNQRLAWLAWTVETYRGRLHAFSLMDEREHLFAETLEPNLSTINTSTGAMRAATSGRPVAAGVEGRSPAPKARANCGRGV